MLLVSIQRRKLRLMEMQITALLAPEGARKAVMAAVEAYRRQLFPGSTDKKVDDSLEVAKKALAKEAQKVYIVNRLDTTEALQSSISNALASGAPELAKAALVELKKKQTQDALLKMKLEGLKKKSSTT